MGGPSTKVMSETQFLDSRENQIPGLVKKYAFNWGIVSANSRRAAASLPVPVSGRKRRV